MMRKVICLRVHRCTFYHSQMPVSSFTDAHLYVYRCRAAAVDVKVFIEKRNGLGSRLIMTKLGTLRSQFMKSSVYKGEFPSIQRDDSHSLK